MSDYLNFLIVGFGAGAAYAAIGLGLVVTYKGTGIINFAAGAMGAWGCYVYDELRRSGNLLLPLPINHASTLGADGSYGGVPLVLFTLISGGLFLILLRFLIVGPLRRRAPKPFARSPSSATSRAAVVDGLGVPAAAQRRSLPPPPAAVPLRPQRDGVLAGVPHRRRPRCGARSARALPDLPAAAHGPAAGQGRRLDRADDDAAGADRVPLRQRARARLPQCCRPRR